MARRVSPERESRDREQVRALFEREVERLLDRLYGTALRLTRDPDDAEDVVAEAVSKAWSSIDQLDDPGRLEHWLFRILNNTFISMWRRRKRRQEVEYDEASPGDTDSGEVNFSLFQKLHQPFLLWWGTPEQQFLNNVLRDDIRQAMDALPDPFRVAIMLVEVQGYTYEESAQMLGVPLGTIRSRLNRGRGLLQQALWQQARDAGLAAVGAERTDREQTRHE